MAISIRGLQKTEVWIALTPIPHIVTSSTL